jgi:hypothetical protein
MVNKIKKDLLGYLFLSIQVLVILAGAFGVYYYFLLRPALALPSRNLELKKVLVGQHDLLVGNRILVTGLTKVSPTSSSVGGDVFGIIASIRETNEGAQKEVDIESISGIRGIDSEEVEKLLEDTRRFYQEQELLIKDISDYSTKIELLLSHTTQKNLRELVFTGDRGDLIESTYGVRNSLEGIRKNSDNLGSEMEVFLNDSIFLLGEFVEAIETDDITKADKIRWDLIIKFDEMRDMALESVKEIVRNEQSVRLLTMQTNLIYKYDHLIGDL